MDILIDNVTEGEEIRFALERVYHDSRTAYQHAQIVELLHHGRTLVLDGSIQSSERDEAYYHEALVQPAMLLAGDPGAASVLILGGGEGATLREVLRHPSVERAVMVDLDREVVDICREHLPTFHAGAFDDPRTELFYEDAEKHLREHDVQHDVIVFDIVDPSDAGPAVHLFSRGFFELLKTRLKPGGILTLQYGPAFVPHLGTAARVLRTVGQVFAHATSGRVFVPSYHGAWGIAVASDHPVEPNAERLATRAATRLGSPLVAFDGASLAAVFQMPAAIRRAVLAE